MSFSFNKVFKKAVEEEPKSVEQLKYEFDNLKENMHHKQNMIFVGIWNYCIVEKETFFSDEIYSIFESSDKSAREQLDKFNKYIHPEDKARVLKSIKLLLQGQDCEIEYRIITPNGLTKYIYEKTKTIYDIENNPINIIGVIQDMTEVKGNYNKTGCESLFCKKNNDTVTGFKNRHCFLEDLELLKKDKDIKEKKYGLLIIEVDGIKNTNFSLGYKLGNQLILEIANRLKMIFPANDSICRYSENDFAIIVEGGKGKPYEGLAEKIIETFSKPFKIDAYELTVKTNIGICVFPKEEEDSLPLKNRAKIALINSKKRGRNRYEMYSSELNIEYYKEFILRSDLYHAIEKKQLEIYYQPIINLKTNEIMCAEVLIRWNHPEWGIVPPDEFISIAEETGLIVGIGKWVLREVCKNYRKWTQDDLTNINIGVNFSSIQFFEKDFVDNIKNIIDEYCLDPKFLIMEIKESIFLKDENKATKDIKKLRTMGVQIAFDDFGTGFSSFSYLNPLNINILKLDKSFIDKIPLDRTANIITKAAVKLAGELRMKFVAKGIESLEQLSYLKKINCVIGQGNIYSEAVPLEKFEKLLLKKQCKPRMVDYGLEKGNKDKRKFFRIDFLYFLETNLTIMEIAGKRVNVGNTKVLVKDIGPGGLCFFSNIRFPTEKRILFKFTTNLIEKEMLLYGRPVWNEELDDKIYKYGVEFKIEENEREDLFKTLNQVQLKMRNNILFNEGSFIDVSYERYFK